MNKIKPVHELLCSHNLVTVLVGPEKVQWSLHEELICDRSEYFRKAFKGQFKEGQTKEIHLEEDDPQTFGLFVDWLYGASLQNKDDDHNSHADAANWCKLCVFADKINIGDLKYKAFLIYGDFWSSRPSNVEEIIYIYENTLEHNLLRRFAILSTVNRYMRNDFDDFGWWVKMTTCHAKFAKDVEEQVKAHMTLDAKVCTILNCTIHRWQEQKAGGNSSAQVSQGCQQQ